VRAVARLTRLAGLVAMCGGLAWGAPFLLRGRRRERFDAFLGERAPALLPLFAGD
jgi:hypothetical protein